MATTSINTHLGANIAWTVYRNGYNAFVGTLTLDGVAYDISDRTFTAYIRTPEGNADKLTLTEGNGITNGGAVGTLTIALTEAQLATLPRDRYFIVVEYTISGKDYPLCQGYIEITDRTNPRTTTTSATIPVSIDGVTVNMAVTIAPTLAAAMAYTDQQIAIAVFDNNIRTITPEYFGAVGDGTTDDAEALQDWADYVCDGTNKVAGRGLASTYLTSAMITFTGSPDIDISIKRSSGSVATGVVSCNIGINARLKITVDGNSSNATECTGIRIYGNQNRTAEYKLYAQNCDTGIVIEGNVENVNAFCSVYKCEVGVNVRDYNGGSPDEIKIVLIGSECNNYFTANGSDESSGSVELYTEAYKDSPTNAIIQSRGTWTYSGLIRSFKDAILINGDARFAGFNNLQIKTSGQTGTQIVVDGTLVDVQGSIFMAMSSGQSSTNGVWIKQAKYGSSLLIKQQNAPAGYGLQLGDSANAKTVNGFVLQEGSQIGGAAGAVVLDQCGYNIINLQTILSGSTAGIIINENGDNNNTIRINRLFSTTTITNNGTDDNNVISFFGRMTTAQRDAIPSPAKGYRCEAVDDGNVIVQMNYNANTSSWE